jgi:hypothetical protein
MKGKKRKKKKEKKNSFVWCMNLHPKEIFEIFKNLRTPLCDFDSMNCRLTALKAKYKKIKNCDR